MSKIIKTVVEGNDVLTMEETTLVDSAISAVTAPIALFSDDGTEFVSKQTAAISAVGWGAAGFLFGNRHGHKAAAAGKNPIVGGAIVSI